MTGVQTCALPILRESLLSDLAFPYKKIKEKGIKFRRVHIVDLPLTSYMQYELESYQISAELGEEIRIISMDTINNLEFPINLQDYLMFDEKIVVLHFYDNKAYWQSGVYIDNPEEVAPYVRAKELLLNNSVPLETFREKLQF